MTLELSPPDPSKPANPASSMEDPARIDPDDDRRHPRSSQRKKQVRRRLHTTKPYQEKPINMAKARREIVAALKYHRAAMKQQQQQRRICPPQPRFLHATATDIPSPSAYPSAPNANTSWSHSHTTPLLPPSPFSLPDSRPLGLALDLRKFDELETTINSDNCLSLSFSSSSTGASTSTSSFSSSLSSSYVCSPVLRPELPSVPSGMPEATSGSTAEMQCMTDEHGMEWSDDPSLLQSDWWNTLLDGMDSSLRCVEERIRCGVGVPDKISSSPSPWDLDQYLLNYPEKGQYPADASLPCLDIDDIEVMDGEWLL